MPTAMTAPKESEVSEVVVEPAVAAVVAVTTDEEVVLPVIDISETINSETSTVDDDVATSIPAAISEMTSVSTSRKDTSRKDTHLTPSVSSPATRSQTLPKSRKRSTPEKYVPPMFSNTKRNLDTATTSKRSKIVVSSKQSPNDEEAHEVEEIDVEEIDDDSSTANEGTTTIDTELLKKLERELIKKQSKAAKDSENTKVTDAADECERRFLKCLCQLKIRNESRIGWAGFLLGYYREIRLTEYGKKYMKTRKLYYNICL
jgi:hypothetical protein